MTRVRALYGRRGYWLREPSDTGEVTIAKILATMTGLGGGDCFCPKVADGLNFQGANDAQFACNSLDDIIALRDFCFAANMQFLPVVVARGVIGEAEFHGQIASAIGCLMVDAEPYSGFFDQNSPSLFPVYAKALRAASADAYLIVQPDPRQFGLAGIRFSDAVGFFDGICGQHYVGWTSVGWTNVQTEVNVFDALAAFGKDMYVTLYGADPSFPGQNTLPVDFWNQVQPMAVGVCWFVFGQMNTNQLKTAGGILAPAVSPDPLRPIPPDPPPNPPGPVPPFDDEWAFRLLLGQLCAANAADLTDTDQTLDGILPLVTATASTVIDVINKRGQSRG